MRHAVLIKVMMMWRGIREALTQRTVRVRVVAAREARQRSARHVVKRQQR